MENGIIIVQAILCLAYSAYAKDNALLVRGDMDTQKYGKKEKLSI